MNINKYTYSYIYIQYKFIENIYIHIQHIYIFFTRIPQIWAATTQLSPADGPALQRRGSATCQAAQSSAGVVPRRSLSRLGGRISWFLGWKKSPENAHRNSWFTTNKFMIFIVMIRYFYQIIWVPSSKRLLVGGLGHDIFPFSWEFIIPTDFHIFQRGWNHQPVVVYGGKKI